MSFIFKIISFIKLKRIKCCPTTPHNLQSPFKVQCEPYGEDEARVSTGKSFNVFSKSGVRNRKTEKNTFTIFNTSFTNFKEKNPISLSSSPTNPTKYTSNFGALLFSGNKKLTATPTICDCQNRKNRVACSFQNKKMLLASP